MPGLLNEMQAMLADFRSCYLSGLRTEPKMGGTLEIVASVASDGHVTDAHVENDRGVSRPVASCVVEFVAEHAFAHPSAEASTVRVPMNFVPSSTPGAKGPTGS